MPRMSKRAMESMDRRLAGIHEAGHLTAAMALGLRGEAEIYPLITEDRFAEKTWGGQFRSWDGMPSQVAVAGITAEVLADEPDMGAYDLACQIWDEDVHPSATDLARFPPEAELEKVIVAVIELLTRHARFHRWATNKLIWQKEIFNHVAYERFIEFEGGRSR